MYANLRGNQLLTIGMVTPTGNPIEELTYKKTRNTIYTVCTSRAVVTLQIITSTK